MTDRPTPEQIIGRAQLDDLGEHGYMVVYPDDVPEEDSGVGLTAWEAGWNACRHYIFGRGAA